MTRIDFYILDNNTPQARENFACRLIEKAQHLGHSIFVQSQTTEHAELLDDLLWSYKPESFIPHALSKSASATNCSVVISTEQQKTEKNKNNDVLINFSSTVPDLFSQYSRVVEIVNKNDNSSIDGRTRYKYYNDRGYQMEYHNIRG
ncbi:MAG: DNA polymerase III subunit chi [Thiohalomonadales bacterium]